MAYATLQDAIDLFGTDYVNTSVPLDEAGDPDTAKLTAALDGASTDIDSYLGALYTVPLTVVPAAVKRCCVEMAMYLASRGPGGGETESKRTRYEDQIKWLTLIAKRVVSIGIPTASTDGVSAQVPQVSIVSSPRLFTRCKMGGM
jgi:phage gp36-like protein